MFSHKMISLESLENWTLFNVLKQVKAAGYSGAPSEPIAAYRTALLSTMSYNQPNENERIGPIYLKAEKAYIALDVCIFLPLIPAKISNMKTDLERVSVSRTCP